MGWSGRNLDWEISHLILGWDGTLSSEEHSVKVSSRVYIHIATNARRVDYILSADTLTDTVRLYRNPLSLVRGASPPSTVLCSVLHQGGHGERRQVPHPPLSRVSAISQHALQPSVFSPLRGLVSVLPVSLPAVEIQPALVGAAHADQLPQPARERLPRDCAVAIGDPTEGSKPPRPRVALEPQRVADFAHTQDEALHVAADVAVMNAIEALKCQTR